jgi:6-phospho-beta-glucosidase
LYFLSETIADKLPRNCQGPHPINWGKFEPAARGMVQIMKSMEETTISAAVTGNYNKALHAFTINPLVPSGEIAKELLDEMLVAHKKHLSQFKEKIEELTNEVKR